MSFKEDLARLRERWYREGFFTGKTLGLAFAEGAEAYPEAPVIFHSADRPLETTVGALHARARKLAGALSGLGLKAGDVVALQVPNWAEGLVTFQACTLLGLVVVPIVHIYDAKEVGFILRQSRARMFVVPDRWRHIDYLDRLARLPELPDLAHTAILGADVPAGCLAFGELEAQGHENWTAPDISPDDMVLLVYTSGTTADPKGVRHSHNTVQTHMKAMDSWAPVPPGGACLSPWPAGHVSGLLYALKVCLAGYKTILMDAWDSAEGARLIEAHNVTTMGSAPIFTYTLFEAAGRDGRDISSFRISPMGGTGITPADVAAAEARGVKAYRCYGSSEHPTATAGALDDPIEKRGGTDGRPMEGTSVRIVDDDGNDLPAGEEGEVACVGPYMFLGYTDDKLNETCFLPGGWFRTGDIGWLDTQGYLTITDRKKDVIIRGGENISSKEVEDVLATHPDVLEAVVVAMPDPKYGEKVCAYVILKEGASLSLEDVKVYFAGQGMARQKTPERLIVNADLPRTPVGKVKKFELRTQLREEARRTPA